MSVLTKTCGRCKAQKPCGDFYVDRSQRDGRMRICVDCARELNRQYYEVNADRLKARDAQRREQHAAQINARRRELHAERKAGRTTS
ncbi:hypothetical protein ADM96_08280 [Burkholderia sp. ST111]|nr:hypothetical protein ADM96_08280 [Burkholderia sp. ST111]